MSQELRAVKPQDVVRAQGPAREAGAWLCRRMAVPDVVQLEPGGGVTKATP